MLWGLGLEIESQTTVANLFASGTIVNTPSVDKIDASRKRSTLGPVITFIPLAAGSKMLWIPLPNPPPTIAKSAKV